MSIAEKTDFIDQKKQEYHMERKVAISELVLS